MIQNYSIPSIDGKGQINILLIENKGTVRHRGGDKTTLIMARITKVEEGNTIFEDMTDFISFEIPYGAELNIQLLELAMRQYEQNIQLKDNTQRDSYYLGRLSREVTGQWIYANKSMAVEGIVQKEVQKEIQEREVQRRKSFEENQKLREKADKAAMYKASLSAREHLARKEEERNNRKLQPFLKKDEYPINKNARYPDYTGVDLHTGDILRVRQVDKIGKDGSGTYLYSAYLSRKANETDVEFVDVEEGPYSFVCFELQKRLEDIVRDQNRQEIITLLELLSDNRAFENQDKLTYLGEIDKTGQVNRREKSTSNAIQTRIEFMKKQYETKMKERIEKNREGLYNS